MHIDDDFVPGIRGYYNQYYWLSNFYYVDVEYEGDVYSTVEHAYQAAKAITPRERIAVKEALSPELAKKVGKGIAMRPDWNEIKIPVMRHLLLQKFGPENPTLHQRLLDTEDLYLEETNDWGDVFWGVCNGKGENNLGKLQMEIRSYYRRLAAK